LGYHTYLVSEVGHPHILDVFIIQQYLSRLGIV
jgi:hypothetical protein